MSEYRLYVNDDLTVLVRVWASGKVEVSFRPDADHVWGPPIVVVEVSA